MQSKKRKSEEDILLAKKRDSERKRVARAEHEKEAKKGVT